MTNHLLFLDDTGNINMHRSSINSLEFKYCLIMANKKTVSVDKRQTFHVLKRINLVFSQLEVHEAKAMLDNHPQWDIPDTEEEDEEQEDSDGIEESEDDDEDND